jgi:hypothetical protein
MEGQAMLDPFFEWMGRLFTALGAAIRGLIRAIVAPFSAAWAAYRRSSTVLRYVIAALILPWIVFYAWFLWHAAWIRDLDIHYADALDQRRPSVAAGEQVAMEGGESTTRTCAPSAIVDATAHIIDFNVNTNQWISSNPFYKAGLFWVVDWDDTYFLDNKAAFQRGAHQAAARTAVELADVLGRVRGTSAIDPDLKIAKGNIQFNQYTWWFNPFDAQPFGPTTPSPTYYRNALDSLHDYNVRLTACEATFDARTDNLLQFLDRIAKDIGSTSATIKDRAEQYDSGWFDGRADDIFMYARGQLYAYYGILRAARADFADVVDKRELDDIWDLMDAHLQSAIALDPTVVSNGKEDGWVMPTHLTTIGFYILRARSNLVEIRSVIDR